MKLRTLLCGFVFGVGTVLLSSQVISQVEGEPAVAEEEPALSNDELVAAVRKAAAIGRRHSSLKKIRSDYEQTITWRRSAGAKGEESEAMSGSDRILGGRFLTQNVRGKWLGTSFEGYGILGFDNVTQEYVMAWMDTLSTRIMLCKGAADEGGKVITMHGEYQDPITNKARKIRLTLSILNKKGETRIEISDVTTPDQEFKFLEIDSKRLVRAAA